MQNSLLIRTFRSLDAREARAVAQFSRCDFYNRRPEVARLAEHLAASAHKKATRLFAPETLFEAAFPTEKYDNARLRQAMSGLLEVVRRFLVAAELEADAATSDLHLVQALRRRNLDRLFEKESLAAARRLEAPTEARDARWQLQQYRLRQERLEPTARRERSSRLDLGPLGEHLTAFYLCEMLRHACGALTHQAISAQSYDKNLIENALEMAEKGAWPARDPLIALYFHICRALLEPDRPEHFEAWQAALAANPDAANGAEGRTIFLAGINHCIRRMNRGEKPFIRAAFDLYRTAIERDILKENGWLTGFTFKNAIRIAAALGEHEWVADFFEKGKMQLHPAERDALSRYNRAYLFFQKGDFAAAMPMLQSLDLEDRLNLLDARRMLLRSLVELGEWAALEGVIASFSAFLKRQDDLGYHRDLYLNLTFFLKKWLEIRLAPEPKKPLADLRTEIEATEAVAEKLWLLEKLDG